MIRNSIVAKLWLTIVAMVVVVLALLSILLQQFLDNYIYQQQSQQLTRVAESVQMLLEAGENQSTAISVARHLVTIQDSKIQVEIATSISDNASLQKAYDGFTTAEKQRYSAGKPVIERITAKDKNPENDAVSVYLPISLSTPHGMLEVSQQMSALHEPITLMRNLIVFSVGLGILLTTGLAFVLSKNISRPLVQMNRVAEEMANGKFQEEIDVTTTDEVGRLGKTFNMLASELDKSIHALSQEKEQLSSILSSLNDGVVAADLDGNITLANPPALRRLIALFSTREDAQRPKRLPIELLQLMSAVMHKRGPISRELTWSGREVLATMAPLYESDGQQIRGVVSVQRDITEERRLDRLRKDFIANVSHELRTPLSMMQGYSEALLDDFGNDVEQRIELTEIIHDEAIRMKRLVNDLLNLAQLESGHFQMSMSRLNLVDVGQRVARKFHALAQEHNVSLHFEVSQDSIVILGDEDRMEQVFTNLMDNAVRHCNAGGTVSLLVHKVEDHARIQVRDTGGGISQEDLPYIWERFYKADKARTRGQGGTGTGLGLAITRYIVLEHEGDIVADSERGKGTVFTISIPLAASI